MAQALQSTLAALLGPSGVEAGAGWRWGLGRSGWAQAHATNLEVFLEAVELEPVGEFEGTHVTALSVDFPLAISDDGAQVLEGVTGAQQFVPYPLPVAGQNGKWSRALKARSRPGRPRMPTGSGK